MHRKLRHIVFGLVGIALAAAPAAAQGKIGYVNTQAVLAQTPAMAGAQAEFNKRVEPFNIEAQKMDSTLKAMVADLTNDEAGREAKTRTFQERQAEYEGRMQAIEDTVQSFRERLIGPIMQELQQSLDAVRTEGGFAMIIDVAQGSVIVSADTTLDVTEKVIAKMKNMATPTAAAVPTGPVAAPAGVGSRPGTPDLR